MERQRFLQRQERETLRERWLLRAGQAFERMFAEANQDQLVTFTEREDLACLLGGGWPPSSPCPNTRTC